MFYDYVMKILDVSRKRDVDVLVARDMIISEDKIAFDVISPSSNFISRYYDEVTKCRRLGKDELLRKFITAYTNSDKKEFDTLRNEIISM